MPPAATTTLDCLVAVTSSVPAERSLAHALLALTAAVPSRWAWGWAVDAHGAISGEMIVLSRGPQPRDAEDAGRAYRERYWLDDPFAAHRFLDSQRRVLTTEAAGGPRALARSVYGAEFFTPAGWADEVDLFLRDAGRMTATIKLLRSRDDPPFRPHDVAALTLIQPLAELAYAAAREPLRALANERALSDKGLRPREIEVARLAALGRTNDEIARALSISVATAKRHLTTIYRRLGVRSRTELTVLLSPMGRASRSPR